MMKRIYLFLALAGVLTQPVAAQERQTLPAREQFAQTITPADMSRHLHVLADDSMEGRETGQPGQYKAARYLEEVIRGLGLPPVGPGGTWSQPMSYISERWNDVSLTINGEVQRHLWNYFAYPSHNADLENFSTQEVVFLGYGIATDAYNDYDGQALQGKTILILGGEPMGKDGLSRITGTATPSEWSSDVTLKLQAAKSWGGFGDFIGHRFSEELEQCQKDRIR
ncbi:MAG: hypothetical protein R2795_06070 [Saprospiraceae bacterium]